ncbi:MAG: ABC transporter ATP-binding protein [Thermofilaceae archaeon]
MGVEAVELGKRFGETWGVREITFSVKAGSVAVLAGPNGAGKTTTTRILTTYYKPDKGWARVCGFDVVKEFREVRRRVAYLPQGYGVSGDLTPEELVVASLMMRGFSYFEAKRAAREWLEELGLWEIRSRRFWVLSGGEKRRAVVASVLAEPAEVYFLDEPTTGIDVEGRYEVLRVVRRAAAKGATVFMTTHNLSEAQLAADEVFFINAGRTVLSGKPSALLEAFPWKHKAIADRGNGDLKGFPHLDLGDKVVIYAKARDELFSSLSELKLTIYEVREVDLEDIYLYAVRVK